MLRLALFVLLFASALGFAQNSAQDPGQQTPATSSANNAASQPVSQQVTDAEAAILKSDWKAAEAKLDPWLAAHPTDARALFDAGYVVEAQNRLDDAAGLYRRAVEAEPQSFEAHLALDPGEAGPAIKARAWRALAEIDRAIDTTEASNDLLEALKLTPETPQDTLLAANLADQAGQFDAAETAYRRILAADPKSASANSGLAHLLIQRKQYPEAETLLRAALEQSPGDTALTAQLATVLAAQDKAEALPLIQKLHQDHPADASITHILAEVLAAAGDFAGSEQLCAQLLAATPDDPALLAGHGQNLIRQLKFAEAFAAFDKATQLDPANADGWSGLAFAASQTNKPSITLHALTMRSKYLPEIPSTYFLWATAYDTLHQQAMAATYFHRFLDSSAGKFPDQERHARQRLISLENKK